MKSMWYDKQGKPLTMLQAAKLMQDPKYKIIRQDTNGAYLVSTVWLGLDHRFGGIGDPMIFETMVFEGREVGLEVYTRRYTTEESAIEGHDTCVEQFIGVL